MPDVAESLVEVAALFLFTTKKRNTLAIFPDAGQRITEFGLQLVFDL